MVENIVGKGGNAGYLHFSHFPTMFSKDFFFGVIKSGFSSIELTDVLNLYFKDNGSFFPANVLHFKTLVL